MFIRPVALSAAALLLSSCMSSGKTKEVAPVEPTAVSMAPFAGEVGMGISYLQTRGADLREAVGELLLAVESADLDAAKDAYVQARAPYEEIQVMAPLFPELDRAIDGRAYEFEGGELSTDFRGFHRIEIFLYSRGSTKPAIPYALQLVDDVEELEMVLADRALYDAWTSFDAMVRRCDELGSRTITSEEETWSDQSLLVIRHGWLGVHSQYRHFARDLRAKDVVLAERLDRVYRQALEIIAADFPMGEVAGAPYSLIDTQKRRAIADACVKLRIHIEKAGEVLELAPEV